MSGANSHRRAVKKLTPDPEAVREAAQYLERGNQSADYIAYRMSKEILRLAKIASKESA